MDNQAFNNKNIYIYVFDDTLIKNGKIAAIGDDNGRTKQLRDIMKGIIDVYNNTVEIHVKPQVYAPAFKCCDNPLNYKNVCKSCDSQGFYDLLQPFILFVHTTNACSARFIDELLKKDNNIGNWIACYSGGEEPEWYKEFNTKGLHNIRFFGGIGDAVESKWDIPAFVKAVLDKKENAFDCLVRKPKSHLIALSILCQGYLAAHGKIELPKGISIPPEKKKLTLQQEWWVPALGDGLLEKELEEEVKTIGKDASVIIGKSGLLKAIGAIPSNNPQEYKIPEFTNKVFNAYEYLKTNVFSSNK